MQLDKLKNDNLRYQIDKNNKHKYYKSMNLPFSIKSNSFTPQRMNSQLAIRRKLDRPSSIWTFKDQDKV